MYIYVWAYGIYIFIYIHTYTHTIYTYIYRERDRETNAHAICLIIYLLIPFFPSPGEEALLQQQLFHDYSDRGHMSEFGDTSSTETLGHPHNMIADPRAFLADREDKQSISSTATLVAPTIREAMRLPPLSLPQDLSRGGAQRLLRGRLARHNVKTFLRVFLVAFIFVVFVLTCSVILVFESEGGFLQGLATTREMMLLRIQYYQPIKELFRRWLGHKL